MKCGYSGLVGSGDVVPCHSDVVECRLPTKADVLQTPLGEALSHWCAFRLDGQYDMDGMHLER